MVAGVSSGFNPSAYAYYSSMGSGRLSLPVASSEVVYASFEHVTGFAAASGQGTMSVDSLKILDSLIAHLQSIKNEPLQAAEAPKDLTPGRVEALIQQYGEELHAKATAPAKPYVPSIPAPSGMLFSFAA